MFFGVQLLSERFFYGENENMSFHQNFKEARKKKGYTQEALAQLLGIERSTIAHIESGNNYPQAKLLPKIKEVLQISLDELFECNE